MTEGKRTCFEAGGHLTKSGQPCGYFVAPEATSCPHHAVDKAQQKEILAKAQRQRKEATIPNVDTNSFKTVDDCLRVRGEVVNIVCREKVVDFRRLDMILKAASGASADHATKAIERQNEILLSISGHGAGVAMLQRLKEAPLRVLPGKHKVLDLSKVLDAKESSPDKDPAPTGPPTESTPEPQGA
jgi:hypothetical protein